MIARADIQHLPLPDSSVDLIFTDPPYANASLPCYWWLAKEAARVLRPGAFVLAMAGNLHVNQVYRFFDDAGLTFFFTMYALAGDRLGRRLWANTDRAKERTVIVTPCKPIPCYSRGPGRPRARQIVSLWETTPGVRNKSYHHWGQPVDEAAYFIECFSRPGDLVLDPFVGGGTTTVACQLTGRRALAFDIDPVALATTQRRMTATDHPQPLPLFQSTT